MDIIIAENATLKLIILCGESNLVESKNKSGVNI